MGPTMNFHSFAFSHEPQHVSVGAARPPASHRWISAVLPLAIGLAMALSPPPLGLAQYSWWYLSLFVTVIVGLIVEPVPAAAVGFLGVTAAAVLPRFVLFSPAQLAGLGKRVSLLLMSRLGGRTPTLGYAIMLADLVLAPFTPSNTARSGGTIYPVIKNIPEFYQSLPNDPSSTAQRSVVAAHRRLPDVGGDRVHRCHQLDVPDRTCAQSSGDRAGA